MKGFYQIELRRVRSEAEMYREKSRSASSKEAKSCWADMALVMDEQAFVFECASR